MFSAVPQNEKKYGVTSTYKENLEGYTVQLENTNSREYKEAERDARRLAREIEGNASSRQNTELENGGDGDEEEAFSAVQRPPMRQVYVKTMIIKK